MNDFLTRLIPGFIYMLLILVSLFYGPYSFIIMMFICSTIIIFEYGRVLRKDDEHIKFISIKKQPKFGFIFFNTEFTPLSSFFILFLFGIAMILNNPKSSEWIELSILILSIIYFSFLIYFILTKKLLFSSNRSKTWPLIGVIFSFLLIIYTSLIYDYSEFKILFLLYLFLIWGVDTLGYIVGVKFGKTKLFESLSPKKSIEGAVGSLVFAILYSILVFYFTKLSFLFCFILCVSTCILAILGDLGQSKVKRELKIKDFGKLLPGHGGLYDRFDSILFSFPFIYLIIKISLYVS
jgi:phosphatidate cytidylyltransferase